MCVPGFNNLRSTTSVLYISAKHYSQDRENQCTGLASQYGAHRVTYGPRALDPSVYNLRGLEDLYQFASDLVLSLAPSVQERKLSHYLLFLVTDNLRYFKTH